MPVLQGSKFCAALFTKSENLPCPLFRVQKEHFGLSLIYTFKIRIFVIKDIIDFKFFMLIIFNN